METENPVDRTDLRNFAKKHTKEILDGIKRPELEDVIYEIENEDECIRDYNHKSLGLFQIHWVNKEEDVVIDRIRYDGKGDYILDNGTFVLLEEIGKENNFQVDWS